MFKPLLMTVLCMAGFVYSIKAQDSTAVTEEEKQGLSISGYVDAYYNFAFNKPYSGSLLGGTGAGRGFDRETDQFQLGLIQTLFEYKTKNIEFVGDLVYGPNAAFGNFGNSAALNPPIGVNIGDAAVAIKQAYGTWKATDKLAFTLGQFGTHIGYEVIDAPANYHYSLSNLFLNGPFYHLGAKASYAFSDRLGLMVGIVNNWDGIYDNNKQKSFVSQFYVQPIENWNVYINYIGGKEDFVAQGTNVHLFDFTTGYQVTDKFYFGVNAAYGFMTNPDTAVKAANRLTTASHGAKESLDWWGVALYPNYQLTEWLGIGVRYEYFQDVYGIRYFATSGLTNQSLTLTTPITLAKGMFTFKPELRYDGATQAVYEGSVFSNGVATGSKAVKEQITLGFAGIFKF
jgi:hypothetical protein